MIETILEAILLVVLVVILFLQTWRAAIIPLVAIPVSLIGTFFFMAMFGFSLNNLSLFGLVLAVGIVVDDAIVVVENVERNIADGLEPARGRAAAAWTRSARALIAIALVLCAVFVPSAFITGISGQFYRQFALTIAGATVISLHRLADAVAGAVRAAAEAARPHAPRPLVGAADARLLRHLQLRLRQARPAATAGSPRASCASPSIMLLVYAGIIAFGLNEFRKTPIGFIPQLDRGYLIVVAQLPPGASLARTDAVKRRVVDIALKVPGVVGAVNIVGFSGATFTNAPNAGAIFLVLDPFEKRAKRSQPVRRRASRRALFGKLRGDPGGAGVRGAAAAGARASATPAASA